MAEQQNFYNAELAKIIGEVKHVRSQAFGPNMGEFSQGYEAACDDILARIGGIKIEAGKITLESVSKRLADVEAWIDRRKSQSSTVAVHVFLDTTGFANGVHLFRSEEDAEIWMLQEMRQLGGKQSHLTIEQFQDNLEPHEWFDTVELYDRHR